MRLVFASILAASAVLSGQTPARQATAAAVVPGAALKANETTPAKASKPEALHYTINWASGLSFGDAMLSSSKATLSAGPGWTFTLKADASVPGYKLQEAANSTATPDYCSLELDKDSVRGKRKVDERTTFDSRTLSASRETQGGGKSDMTIPACAKDALAYLFFLRRELSQGRLPAQQKVYFGAPYDVRAEYGSAQTIKLGDESIPADRLLAHIKGPKTTLTVEMFLSKDPARLPLLIQIPLAQGQIRVELVR